MTFDPELVAWLLFAVFAPIVGIYLFALYQAHKYQTRGGALSCLERSTLDPP